MWFPSLSRRKAPTARILFILKRNQSYTEYGDSPIYSAPKCSGLYNSARFVVDMLRDSGVECKIVEVIDNNCIDREVTAYKPTHVIIEALWVVPEKFEILHRLHPRVQWIVRGHSEIPFLSNEGIAIEWLRRYVELPNVFIATNSLRSYYDLRQIVLGRFERKVLYLPNYYPAPPFKAKWKRPSDVLDIACFGAIRPLKNNLIQAVAAIRFANQTGKRLRFHINGTRSEQGGNNNLKNLRALFARTQHKLVEHPWLTHEEFLKLLRTMDVSMNVSFTESFNIISADSVACGVALVTSPEVHWASSLSEANPTSTESIAAALDRVTKPGPAMLIKLRNLVRLKRYSANVRREWLRWIECSKETYSAVSEKDLYLSRL